MVKLVQLLVEYQENKSEDAFNEILKMVESIIYFASLKVRKDYQEDLRQECCLKLLESILDFEIKGENEEVIEMQFKKYLKRNLCYVIKEFYRNNYVFLVNVNVNVDDLIEWLEIKNEKFDLEDYLYSHGLSKEEVEFILCFIENSEILTQEKVAAKLNISRQKVSRILKKIKEKFNRCVR
ncbi:MAG TPA: hypothetical protein DCX39_05295 [Firmicutes bacterium]|nr:hypothetical protein [Bacillota bacterium]HAX00550.1 hypothetical protein [Bacillota bacterium]